MKLFERLFLLVTIFICGAAVMVLEILGTKVISPFFGVSLYVWSSLITVTLLSLSLGYWLGGAWADRKPDSRLLYGIIFSAGILTALIPSLSSLVIKLTESLELRVGTLSASFLLFFLPLFALGMVSPFAIKLRTTDLQALGLTAGALYAVSTLGSFTGTILSGFVLIPSLPVTRIFYLVSALLVVNAFAGLAVSRGLREGMLFLVVLAAAAGFASYMARPEDVSASEPRIVHQSENFYGQIKVVDYKGMRSLLVNSSPQNFVPQDSGATLFDQSPYAVYLNALLIYRPEMKKMLMVGFGGGTIATMFSRYGITADAIEIDPRMEDIAARYFGYQPRGGKIRLGDGRYVMRRLEEKYDAMVLDAFSSYDQPSHLFTREFFTLVRGTLAENGVLGINTAAFLEGPASRVPRAIFRTLKEVFPYVEAFHIEGQAEVGSVIFFASASPLKLLYKPSLPMASNDQLQLIQTLESSRANDLLEGGILLTDDYNPIPYWGVPIYEAWRQAVINFFGKKVLQKI